MSVKLFVLQFVIKKKINDAVYSYYFDLQQSGFRFLAGQYIQLTLPHTSPDARGTSRFFTISSSPTEKDFLMITSRKGVSSFKKALFELKAGTEIQFFGPIGKFVLFEE